MGFSANASRFLRKHLNFYRAHILYMTFTPLVFSAISYASNGTNHIDYVDHLFNSVSAMTVCGLAVNDLSLLTTGQQAILFIQMCIGHPVFVSWFIVYIRRHYFGKKFQHLIAASNARRSGTIEQLNGRKEHVVQARWATKLLIKIGLTKSDKHTNGRSPPEKLPGGLGSSIRPDMIRRVDDAPKLVDPSGWISQRPSETDDEEPRHLSFAESSPERSKRSVERTLPRLNLPRRMSLSRRMSDPGARTPPAINSTPIGRYETVSPHVESPRLASRLPRSMTRTQTIEFAPTINVRRRGRPEQSFSEVRSFDRSSVHSRERKRSSGVPLAQYSTVAPSFAQPERGTKHSGFGGFPMPHEMIERAVGYVFPDFKNKVTRTVTMPRTTTVTSLHGESATIDGARPVPYISHPIIVGRNSTFHLLDSEQLEELGGVEYRALNALLWIVPMFHIGIQLIGFILIGPYISTRYADAFQPPALHAPLNRIWFSVFQVVSAYTNTGTSLVDQSMLPFQESYLMIVTLMVLILAGNTAFPIFLRFTIWTITKLISKTSRLNETLHFLLDHPRRCYIYLFPSHQTWFLLTVVVLLSCTDWFFFMVLDIGTPAIEQISLGTRFIAGLLQSIAVRAAGFAIVPLASLAPGVRVLYVLMMYVSVYPIAMSVRSTNVYEEQSLGIFKGHEGEDDEDANFQAHGSRMTVWSRYLALHARRQLSFDMWWIALALFLLCVIERDGLDDPNSYGWFNIFTMIFELVSAYGTVGLSLGAANVNYSFSGVLKPLSKLIITLVMLRGRHRGLPVAIDRAILLPMEFDSVQPPLQFEDREASIVPEKQLLPEKLPEIIEGPTPRVSISENPLSRTHTKQSSTQGKS